MNINYQEHFWHLDGLKDIDLISFINIIYFSLAETGLIFISTDRNE